MSAGELRTIARGVPSAAWRRIITIPTPAAGADVTIPVPQAKAWQLLNVAATLTASATAGNRHPLLSILDAGGVAWYRNGKTANVTANTTANLYWAAGVTGETVAPAGDTILPLTDPTYLLPGESITITGHTDAADQWSALRVVVLETNIGDEWAQRNIEQATVDHMQAAIDLWTHGGTP